MVEKLSFIKRNFHKKQDKKPEKGKDPEKAMAEGENNLSEDTEELPVKQRLFGAEEEMVDRILAEYGFVVEQNITYVHTDSYME